MYRKILVPVENSPFDDAVIDHVRERGSTWLDIQVMTPHMRALGAREISRAKFLDLLQETQAKNLELF